MALYLCLLSTYFVAQTTTTKIYRYEIHTHTGDSEFRGELDAVPHFGPAYSVTRDSTGRIQSQIEYEDGHADEEIRWHYGDADTRPDGFELWLNGKLISTSKVVRDSAGIIAREDRFTDSGQLSEYCIVQVDPDRLVIRYFNPDKTVQRKDVEFFGSGGALSRRIAYYSAASDEHFVDVEFDEATGHRLRSKGVDHGEVVSTEAWSYSEDGDLDRIDSYLANDRWYGTTEFEHNRMMRKTLAASGGTKEDKYFYDDNQWVSRVDITFNNRLVAYLTYDRTKDGVVQRTIVRYADGKLMAEYPAPGISEVDRHGHFPGRTDAVFYATKDLW